MKLWKKILRETGNFLECLGLTSSIVIICLLLALQSMHIGADVRTVPKGTTNIEIARIKATAKAPYWHLTYYLPVGEEK
jgi:hypothetical protein